MSKFNDVEIVDGWFETYLNPGKDTHYFYTAKGNQTGDYVLEHDQWILLV